MATLKEIAGNLNISVMAVSKALRDAPDIGAKTKARVRAEADRLGYVPNQIARSLRGGASGLVGLVMPALNEPFAANVAWGIEQEAEQRNFQIILGTSAGSEDKELASVNRLAERQIEVLFIMTLLRLQQRIPILEVAANRKLPVIFLDHFPASASQYQQVSWVVADGRAGGQMATTHLIELGHRDILYLSSPLISSTASEHYSGYQRALAGAGIKLREDLVFMAGVGIDAGRSAMMQVLSEGVEFTAIVCGSDLVAIGAMEILDRHERKIPDDVSIVGFGDGLLAANQSVPLTTIREPQVDMGRAAFKMWHQTKQSKGTMSGRVLPVELVLRESTKVPRIPVKR